ncbi:ATP-binding protein [Tenacibaculum sp. UWU-22]|uniref:ATP-binding protein n=1 Tax=Tenacibaculum sp. UWU-22 TaxID=3234187 RepID=UPI0034DB374A
MSIEVSAFKAKSHILSLLGDELIGSDSLAIFELVKNSYDADSEEVKIIFNDLNTPNQSIVIEDDGYGMTLKTIKDVWLEIGTDFKRGKRRKPSPKFGRISLGEKGVGRLAVHKLGKRFTLETQREGDMFSSRIHIDWKKLISSGEYIQDLKVEIETVSESLFEKGKGTRIHISDLKKKTWSKKEVKDLVRKINTIKNPFVDDIISSPKSVKNIEKKLEQFDVEIYANDDKHNNWIKEVKNVNEILSDSLYYFDFYINEDAQISTYYSFNPPKIFKDLKSRTVESLFKPTRIIEDKQGDVFAKDQKILRTVDLEGIGAFGGRFYVYNLDSYILNSVGQSAAIRAFVRENNGIKIFRDGIRVYNYGEPNDDWLGMILRRLQRVGDKFSKNTVIGAIELSLEDSHEGLVEKTNREGFDDNIVYKKYLGICISILDSFEKIAKPDRDNLKSFIEDIKPVRKVGLSETIEDLKAKLKQKNIEKELSPLIKRVENDYNEMRDVMVNSGMSGLNLSLVFHEVEREMKFLNVDINKNHDVKTIKKRVKHILELLENFSPILKQQKNVILNASKLVETAVNINKTRFKYHNIVFSSPLMSKESQDFQIKGPGNLLTSSISNLIDNAIYWVSAKKEIFDNNNIDFIPRIWISSNTKDYKGPAIIIADNGEGFNMAPEDLIQPFRTTKPGGMGLGLYFVNIVMEMLGGKLIIPETEDLDLPKGMTGASIILVFPKE